METNIKQYKVCWVNHKTKEMGEEKPLSLEDAKAWVEYGNSEYPFITHWIEEVKNA